MTAAPLEKAVEESRKWLSWYGAGMFGEGVDDPGAGGPAELLTALLAAIDADKRLERAGRVLREIEKFCSCSDHECPAAIARRYFAEKGERP